MAEEEVVENENGEIGEEEAKPPKDATKTLIIVLIALAIILMIASPIASFMLVKTMVPEVANAEKESVIDVDLVNHEIMVKEVQCNLKGTNATRYIRLDVALTVNNKDVEAFFASEAVEGVTIPSRLSRIKAKLVQIISDKQVSDLETKDDKDRLASDIKLAVTELLEADFQRFGLEQASILDVYFPSFLIQ